MSRREKTPFRMEPFRVDDELHRSIRVENREDAASTVPLEEALLLDSAEQRRKLILSVLTDDPVQYYDLLEQARLNDDSEVVHYAATAMAQISKQADAALQRHAARFAADPKDPAVLAEYAAALEGGDFDLYLGEVRLTADWDAGALLDAGGALNYGGFASEQLSARNDALLLGGNASAERYVKGFAEETPFAPLLFKSKTVLTPSGLVDGMTPTASDPFYGFADWSFHLSGSES